MSEASRALPIDRDSLINQAAIKLYEAKQTGDLAEKELATVKYIAVIALLCEQFGDTDDEVEARQQEAHDRYEQATGATLGRPLTLRKWRRSERNVVECFGMLSGFGHSAEDEELRLAAGILNGDIPFIPELAKARRPVDD